jgi:hypothetical protein
MERFTRNGLEESFARFERAAAKGHEESIWIMSVVKDMEMKIRALIKAFAITEEPLGYYFAGRLSKGREQFDFYKKSAEGGCSWGQVEYGDYFECGAIVEEDKKVYVEWLEKAANQNNPIALGWLGYWCQCEEDEKKALGYYRASAELGWKDSMQRLAVIFRNGEGCEKDLRQAAIWSAKADSDLFWNTLWTARVALKGETTEDLDCDFDLLCYSLGWGLYWYRHDSEKWNDDEQKAFDNRCLDYYCSCVELQQKSIFTFLLCWNQTAGVNDVGVLIAKEVWEEREDNLLKGFEIRSE